MEGRSLMSRRVAVAAVLATAMVATATSVPALGLDGDRWFEVKLTASDAASGDYFGEAAAIDGDTLVASKTGFDLYTMFSGSVIVFERERSGWTEVAELIASDAQDSDHFGDSVDIEGDTIVVGASDQDNGGVFSARQGAVYVFTRTVSGWVESAKLVPAGIQDDEFLGTSVRIAGDTIVAGAPNPDVLGGGSVYIWTRVRAGWVESGKLTAPDDGIQNFAWELDFDGETIVVGDARDDEIGTNAGAGYIYTRSRFGWNDPVKIAAPDGTDGDGFGGSMAVSGNVVAVGAAGDDDLGDASGSVYIFKRSRRGWHPTAKLNASDGAAGDFFGRVTLDGETLGVIAGGG